MTKPPVPEHERLFDEICGKLNELSNQSASDRWKSAQAQLQERMKSFESYSIAQGDMSQEIKRLSENVEQERQNNGKLAADLAKALELNLKLQFDIEEIRTRASQMVAEERKHNQFLIEKSKSLSSELELSQALNQDVRLELAKAREKFQADLSHANEEKSLIEARLKDAKEQLEATNLRFDEVEASVRRKDGELQSRDAELRKWSEESVALNETIQNYEKHLAQQHDLIQQLTATAEQKLVELKLALDRKAIESHDYYSHLQQALTQIQVLRQENTALKDYVTKITALHQSATQNTAVESAHFNTPAVVHS